MREPSHMWVMNNGWLIPGASVLIVHRNRSGVTQVQYDTVDRVLKRDVVLSSGARFNRVKLSHSYDQWGWETTSVVDADSDEAREAVAQATVLGAQNRVESRHLSWSRDRSKENLLALRDAVDKLLKVTE